MKRSRKSKNVSWFPDENLCQVRLFIADDRPSQVGIAAQDHLQAKATLPPTSVDTEDRPPGFEDSHNLKQLQNRPFIWRCPPKFILSETWQVAAGGESNERGAQRHREPSVLEAVYRRVSAIPPNPTPSDERDYTFDDRTTPVIPITPIEEELADHSLSPPIPPITLSHTTPLSHTNGNLPLPVGDADVFAATLAALAAFIKSQEPGNMIDTDLLIHILNDPKMIENLIRNSAVQPVTGERPVSPALLPVASSGGEPPFNCSGNINIATKRFRPTSSSTSIFPPSTSAAPMYSAQLPTHHISRPAFKITVPNLPSYNPQGILPVPSSPMCSGAVETPLSLLRQGPASSLGAAKALRPRMESSLDFCTSARDFFPYSSYVNGSVPGDFHNYYQGLIKQHGGEIQGYGISRKGSVLNNVHGPNKIGI